MCFTKDKAIHSLEVANFMRSWAPTLNLDPDKAWLIGYTHDIGYIFGSANHSTTGCALMSEFSNDLARYILAHDSTDEPEDDMEFLLCLADLVVDETGKYVGIDERIKSIGRRRSDIDIDVIKSCAALVESYAIKNGYIDLYRRCF